MIRHIVIIGFLCLNTALLFLCGPSTLSGGGGTDLPNTRTVMGILTASDGTPSSHAKVVLVPSNFNVLTDSLSLELQDTTDNKGEYHFSVIDTGEYTITAVQLENSTRAIICSVHIQLDTVEVVTKKMTRPGTIKVNLPDDVSGSTGYIYIPGTTISAKLYSGSNSITLDSIPEGIIPSINYNEVGSVNKKVIRYDVPVTTEKQTTIQYPTLNHAKQVYFNTTPTGAAVTSKVTDFPVLIRLSSSNFSFSQASSDGNEIRFAKMNGLPLSFEIEKWDVPSKSATIWVRLDTLLGNCDTQSIMMYWGALTAMQSESNSAAVFDTADGFQGVWHFAGGFSVYDATANRYNGTPRGNSPPVNTSGAIGNGCKLNGTNFIEMTGTSGSSLNFPQHGTYSISAWVNIDSLSGEYQMIASKGDKQYNLQFRGSTKKWQFTEYQDTTGWDETVAGAVAGSWVYLTGVRSGSKQYFYVNGICADSVIYNHPFIASDTTASEKKGLRNTSCNFMIGKKVDYSDWFFKGTIDEIRVMNSSPGTDWIKLCYMNQKTQDMLVFYKK